MSPQHSPAPRRRFDMTSTFLDFSDMTRDFWIAWSSQAMTEEVGFNPIT
jgi:hypothetical protein